MGGRLVEMTESPEHRNTVENLVELFAGAPSTSNAGTSPASPPWSSMTGRPFPTLPFAAVPAGQPISHRAPRSEDVILLVEVSQSTYRYDKRVKLPRYAEAGIPLLWIVNLDERIVEVYSEPEGRRYTHRTVFGETEPLSLTIAARPDVINCLIPVAEILALSGARNGTETRSRCHPAVWADCPLDSTSWASCLLGF